MKTIKAKIVYWDDEHKVAVLLLEPDGDMAMLPISLLPTLHSQQRDLVITIEGK